jgi:hypothetical protein
VLIRSDEKGPIGPLFERLSFGESAVIAGLPRRKQCAKRKPKPRHRAPPLPVAALQQAISEACRQARAPSPRDSRPVTRIKNAPEFDEPLDQEESYRTNLGSYYRDRETDAL